MHVNQRLSTYLNKKKLFVFAPTNKSSSNKLNNNASNLIIGLGFAQGGEGVVEEFREACGPADPEVARALYPDSIRALLGVQQVGSRYWSYSIQENKNSLSCLELLNVFTPVLIFACNYRYLAVIVIVNYQYQSINNTYKLWWMVLVLL